MWKSRAARAVAVALLAGLAPVVVIAQSASADTACNLSSHKTWVGSSGANWSDPNNWSPAGVPTSADDVCVNSGGPVTVDVVASAASIEATQTLHVMTGESLAIGASNPSVVSTLQLQGNLSVAGALTVNTALQLQGATISGTGSLTNASTASSIASTAGNIVGIPFINNGNFSWASNSLQFSQSFTNNGSVNLSASTPDVWQMTNSATFTNNAIVSATGTSPTLLGTFANASTGHLSVGSGGLATDGFASTQGAVSVTGTLAAGAPSFTVDNGGSLTLLNDASSVSVGTGTSDLVVNPSGSLSGAGIIAGNLDNFGQIHLSVGTGAGQLQVLGSFTGHAGSSLSIPVHGLTAESNFGELSVNGAFVAAGSVAVSTAGYTPTVGDTFRVINATSPTGVFDGVTSNLSDGVVFSSQQDGSGLLLDAIANTGSIAGTVYNDVNGNGARDNGDNGIANQTVFADLNNNGIIDGNDVVTTTDVNGGFLLAAVPSGTVRVLVVLPSGSVATTTQPAVVTVSAGVAAGNVNIGVFAKPSITGTLFLDTNGDGVQDNGDGGVSGKTIFLDTNNNDSPNSGEPTTVTDGSGNYSFSNVAPGTYRVRTVLTGGNVLSTPRSTTTPLSGTNAVANIGLYLFSSVSGTLYADTNGNGVRDPGEQGLAGRTVYVDKNNDGVFDGIDIPTTTAANGTYSFTGLIGAQHIRVLLNPGETQTPSAPFDVALTSGTSMTGKNIGVFASAVSPPTPPVTPTGASREDPFSQNAGYWLAASDGGVFGYGHAPFFGSMGGRPLNQPIVGIDPTPSGGGYHLIARDGGVFSFGDAQFYGSEGGKPLNQPMVAMASTSTGRGYWTVASDGGVFSFGDAQFYGSEGGKPLNSPIVGLVPTSTNQGYWEVAADGGVFSFGDARFFGSAQPYHANHRIIGMASDGDGGYWIADADGGVYTFGDAQFYGSEGGVHLNSPIVAIRSTADGKGYWLFAADGGVFNFGTAGYFGGTPVLNSPIVG